MSLFQQSPYSGAEQKQLENYKGQRLRGAPTSVAPSMANGLEFDYKLSTAAEAAFLTGAKFFLELQDFNGNSIAYYAFPYDPAQVSYARPTAATFTHTLNGGYVREFSSSKTHFISIGGESGVAQRLVVNRRGELVYADGQRAMLELDEFLKRYHEFNYHQTGFDALRTRSTPVKARTVYEKGVDRGLKMIFHSISDQVSFVVEPLEFNYGRDIGRYRHSYQYSLSLKAFEYLQVDYSKFSPFGVASFFAGLDSGLNSAAFFAAYATRAMEGVTEQFIGPFKKSLGNLGNIAREYNRTLTTVDRTIGSTIRVAADFATAINEYKKLWNNITSIGDASFWQSTNSAFGDVGTTWSNLVEARDIVFRDPDEAVLSPNPEDTTPQLEVQQYALRAMSKDLEENPDLLFDLVASGLVNEFINGNTRGVAFIEAEAFFTAFFATSELRYVNELNRSYIRKSYLFPNTRNYKHLGGFLVNDEDIKDFANNTQGSTSNIGSDDEAGIQYIYYPIREGQNLADVARILLPSQSDWPILMELNSWVSIDRNHLNNAPENGDLIKIPSGATASADNNPFVDLSKEEGLLGVDLAVNGNDLVFTGDDLKLAAGEDNIKQFIVHTVMTNKGEIPGLEVFGTPDYVGSAVANEDLMVDYVNISIRQALLADSRIVDVHDTSIQINGTQIDLVCSVAPIVGESSNISIPLR